MINKNVFCTIEFISRGGGSYSLMRWKNCVDYLFLKRILHLSGDSTSVIFGWNGCCCWLWQQWWFLQRQIFYNFIIMIGVDAKNQNHRISIGPNFNYTFCTSTSRDKIPQKLNENYFRKMHKIYEFNKMT